MTLSRRGFIKGAAATGLLAGGAISLNASVSYKTTTPPKILRGNEFHLTIDRTVVNFTGTPRLATTVNGMLPAPTLYWKSETFSKRSGRRASSGHSTTAKLR